MNISDIEKTIKKLGYTSIKRDTTKRLIVYMDSTERVETLKMFSSVFKGGKYTSKKNGAGWRSSVGATELPGGFVILAKPQVNKSTGNISSLDARDFSSLGIPGKFDFNGQRVDVVTFKNPNTLRDSIISGCQNSRLLGDPYAEIFKDFFSNHKMNWSPDTPLPVVNKLGVYAGELLVGWTLLSGKTNKFFVNNPFSGKPKAFHMPTDPAFSGVDSFVEMRDGSYYAISSKYGAGAKASLFTNLFEKGINNRNTLTNSYFKRMCNHAVKNNISYNKSRDFVYSFGIQEILNIKNSEIRNINKLFNDIKTGRMTDEVELIMTRKAEHLQKNKYPDINEDLILTKSPESVSSFFNRVIASKLNSDVKSINQMKEILAGKDYWQTNINSRLWLKGDLKFKFINSGEANLKIIGSKSSVDDLTSKQGWLNYELKY